MHPQIELGSKDDDFGLGFGWDAAAGARFGDAATAGADLGAAGGWDTRPAARVDDRGGVVSAGASVAGGGDGAALGALFLALIANALTLLHLSQFWLQAIYGAVILVAVLADALLVRRMQRAAVARHA